MTAAAPKQGRCGWGTVISDLVPIRCAAALLFRTAPAASTAWPPPPNETHLLLLLPPVSVGVVRVAVARLHDEGRPRQQETQHQPVREQQAPGDHFPLVRYSGCEAVGLKRGLRTD
jgi:hypothetical protein